MERIIYVVDADIKVFEPQDMFTEQGKTYIEIDNERIEINGSQFINL